jgi:ATP-dependent helicase/nuclease subunit A
LALDGPIEHRPGLFIVGDPKQSIYGWRRADLAAYDGFKRRILDDGGAVEPLIRNFRSVQPILDAVEWAVEPVMNKSEGLQPEFQRLEATDERISDPGFDVGDWAPVELWLAWPVDRDSGRWREKFSADEVTGLEAAAIAADIRRLHDEGGVAWGEVAVLIRTTTAQERLLDELRDAGVPFEVARERDYYRQREVVEAAALVRCVLEPGDRLALLTVLRSDAVGVPDAALVPLWESGFPALMADLGEFDETSLEALGRCIERARQAAPTDLPGSNELPGWPLTVRYACEAVAALRQSVRRDPPDVFVERLRTLWLAEATASARYLGHYRRVRLERFHTELEAALASADGSLAQVARFLRRAVEEGRESALQAEPDLKADAVHVMTIHGAKGLDFKQVYVAQIHRSVGRPVGGAAAEVARSGEPAEYALFGWPTPGFALAECRSRERERAEIVRLLYVAMTRAKCRLVISGGWRTDCGEVSGSVVKSFADLVSRRADADSLAQQLSELRVNRREEDSAVQWSLPGLADLRRDRLRAGLQPAPVPEQLVRRDAAALRQLREDAALQSALPVVLAVSAIAHATTVPDDDFASTDALERDVAMAVGTALHRLLERLDLGAELADQIAASRQALGRSLMLSLPRHARAEAVERLDRLIDRLLSGSCLDRLGELNDRVVARELPLLLAPDGVSAVGAITGAADLVYREDGRLVVADFKTDPLESDDEIERRTERYRVQLELYARALEEALDLAEAPAMELWFLHADRIVRL